MIVGLNDYNNRDLAILHKGDTIAATITDEMSASGWSGGQFGRWVDNGSGQPCLAIADGRYCGFFAFGSNELGDEWTAITNQNTTYDYVVLFFGGNVFYTRTYERYGYLARNGLGPMTPLVYTPQDALFISENGKITTENESDFAIFPPHNFPDGTPVPADSFVFFGVCVVPPSSANNNYICVQTNFGV
jgi:hypothetical protein